MLMKKMESLLSNFDTSNTAGFYKSKAVETVASARVKNQSHKRTRSFDFFTLLSQNIVGSVSFGSPAAVDKKLFLRFLRSLSWTHLEL